MNAQNLCPDSKAIKSSFLRISMVIFIIMTDAVITTVYGQCTLTGPTQVCAGSTGNTYSMPPGQGFYSWHVDGGIITSGGGTGDDYATVTWVISGPGYVIVNTIYCNLTLQVDVMPLPNPTITGPGFVCVDSTDNVYTTQPGENNYTWGVPSGATVTAGGTSTDNTITLTFNTAGPNLISVNYQAPICSASAPGEFGVIVFPSTPTITGPVHVCNNSTGNIYSTQWGMSNYTWGITGGTITNGSGTSAITVTWNTPGMQTIIVMYTNSYGCSSASSPGSINVDVTDPTPTISGPASACLNSIGNVYNTEGGNSNYIWSVSSGGTIMSGGGPSDNTITIQWTATGAQSVSVSYTNTFGCTTVTPTVYPVTVNPLPVVTITGNNPVCLNSISTYNTQPGMTNYVWSVSSGGSIVAGGTTNNSDITIQWLNSGVQSVQVNYTNGNGCTALFPTFDNVIVYALPTPTFVSGPVTVCAGSVGNVYTTQGGMTNYVWSVSSGGTIISGGNSTSNSVTINWNTAGAQTVSVNYTNPNGCTAASPAVDNVTVNPLPSPTISGNNPVCASSVNTYTTQSGMTNYIWSVSPGNSIIAGGATNNDYITIQWINSGVQSVVVNYTNSNGCTAQFPTFDNVIVYALPTPTFVSGPVTVCAGSTGNVYTTQGGMTNYVWSVSSGGTITSGGNSTSNGVTITWNTAGAQTVSVNYTNPNGCTAASPTVDNVTVNPLPSVTNSPLSQTICSGFNTTLVTLTSNVAGSTFTWTATATAGVSGFTASGTSTIPVQTISNSGSTQGTVTYAITPTSPVGCVGPVTNYYVYVNPLPAPTVTGPSVVCVNTSGNVYTTQAGMSNYIWSVSPGGTVTSGGSSTSNTVTVTWNSVGAQFVGINYTNSFGCTALTATNYNVTVNPRPLPTISGPDPACVGCGNVYTTQAGMTNYIWSVSLGGVVTAGGSTNNNTMTVCWFVAGAQFVSVNYFNSSNCSALVSTIYNVTVNPAPVPTISGPTPVCIATTGNVYSTQSGMTNYIWSVSAGGSITAGGGTANNTVTVTWNVAGPQTVSVNYTNSSGCTASSAAVFNVTVNPLPVPTITGQTNMCVNSGYYTYTTETGMQNYTWAVSSGGLINSGSGTNQITVSWIGAAAQTVSVTYTNSTGCNPISPTVLNVTVDPAPDQAGTISGSSVVCAGQDGVGYSVAPIANATTYVWALPPNASIASGAGTNSITVNFAGNATSGDIFVYGNNLCGNGAVSPAFPVTVNMLPGSAGTISGPSDVCIGASGVIYSVAPIANATGYLWSVTGGVLITAGNNTSSITVDFTSSAVSGDITVQGTNSCGNGTVSPDFAVTVNPIPPTPVVTNTGTTLHSSVTTGNQWYYQGTLIMGATGQTYVATQDGYYWDVVTLNGCSSDSSNHVLIIVTGINSHSSAVINIYPVPNDGRFNVSITTASEESFSFRVYNNLGVMIYVETKIEVNGSLTRVVDISTAPNGMYTVVITSDQETVVKSIIVNY
jgi:hypothetical protein